MAEKNKPDLFNIVLLNIIPLVGVLLLDWNPILVFAYYILETISIGFVNIFRIYAYIRLNAESGDPRWDNKKMGLIPFFIIHFGMFTGIQLFMFLGFSDFGISWVKITGKDSLGFGEKIHYILYNGYFIYFYLLSIVINCILLYIELKNVKQNPLPTIASVMFRPYGRIIIQQFVVIFGGFLSVLTFGFDMIFLLVFIGFKILFEYYLSKKNIFETLKKKRD